MDIYTVACPFAEDWIKQFNGKGIVLKSLEVDEIVHASKSIILWDESVEPQHLQELISKGLQSEVYLLTSTGNRMLREAIRLGFSGVIEKPLDIEKIKTQFGLKGAKIITDTPEDNRKEAAKETDPGAKNRLAPLNLGFFSTRIIMFTQAKGGVGQTFHALLYALALEQQGDRVAVVELAEPFGNIGLTLRLPDYPSIADFLKENKALDIKTVMQHLGDQLWLLRTQWGKENWSSHNLQHLLTSLGQSFDWIIVDAGSGWSDITQQFAQLSYRIHMVTQQETVALRSCWAKIGFMNQLGVRDKIRLIINNFRRKDESLLEITEEFLQIPLTAAIPYLPGFHDVTESGDVYSFVKTRDYQVYLRAISPSLEEVKRR